MEQRRTKNLWIIYMTFIVALALTVFPLSDSFRHFRPDWVMIGVVYWTVATPHRVGVITAWMLGLFVDATQGHLLGLNGLIFACVAAFCIGFHQRIRIFPMWKQAYCIGLFVVFKLIVSLFVLNSIQLMTNSWSFWLTVFTTAIMWYPSLFLLGKLRRSFGIT
ncbi:MAG: rod shape-determining protein MreD [Pseudomonadota bacterium]